MKRAAESVSGCAVLTQGQLIYGLIVHSKSLVSATEFQGAFIKATLKCDGGKLKMPMYYKANLSFILICPPKC